jgi:hypothetical protein
MKNLLHLFDPVEVFTLRDFWTPDVDHPPAVFIERAAPVIFFFGLVERDQRNFLPPPEVLDLFPDADPPTAVGRVRGVWGEDEDLHRGVCPFDFP